MTEINRQRLSELFEREQKAFEVNHPKSKAAYANAEHLFGRVPMTWMNKKAGSFPIYFESARGNRIRDIDGNEYIDYLLGSGPMYIGHNHPKVTEAVLAQVPRESMPMVVFVTLAALSPRPFSMIQFK